MRLESAAVRQVVPARSKADIEVLLLLRPESKQKPFVQTLQTLTGIDVRIVDCLEAFNVNFRQEEPQVVLVDIDTFEEDDIALIADLKSTGMTVVALVDRATHMASIRAVRAGANDVLLKPIDIMEARDVLTRAALGIHRNKPSQSGKAIVFMHATGGAGASTLAINSASILARNGGAVGLLDLDIQFGNAANLLDLPATSPIQEIVENPSRLDREMLDTAMARHASGIRVLTAPEIPLPLDSYTPDSVRTILQLAKHSFEHVIVDLPVALENWTDTVLQEASLTFLVSPPTVPAIHRLSQMLALLQREGHENRPFRIVINRPHPSGRTSSISTAKCAKALGRKVDFEIPNAHRLVEQSHNQGQAAVEMKPNGAFATELGKMLSVALGRPIASRRRWPFPFMGS